MSKNLTIFGALVLLVVVAAFFYGQSVRQAPQAIRVDAAELSPKLAEAQAALDAGELERARELLESVDATDPSFLVARQQLALVQVRDGDLAAAKRSLESALLIAPDEPGLHVDISGVLYREGDYAAAETAVLRALELRPGAARAVYKVGLYRIAQGRLAEGVDAYHRAIDAHGSPTDVEYGLGELMRLRDDRPDLPAVHYATAFFARTLDRPSLEVESLERFLALEPDGPVADQAREALERARRMSAG